MKFVPFAVNFFLNLSNVFNFSWHDCDTQKKWKTNVMQNLGEAKVFVCLFVFMDDRVSRSINLFLRDNCSKFPTGEMINQKTIFTSDCPLAKVATWRLGGNLIHFFTDFYKFSLCCLFLTSPVYHDGCFWNSLCKLSVKLLVCSLDSLSCWIISPNWTKSGADVFQVYSIFNCDHPRLTLGWRGYLMSLFLLWSLGCFWKLPKIAWHCAFISETLRSKFFGISRYARTSRSHVTTVLPSELECKVHDCVWAWLRPSTICLLVRPCFTVVFLRFSVAFRLLIKASPGTRPFM